MSECLIGLGSNLGDRRHMLDEAVLRLACHAAVRLVAQSPWIETPPAGGPAGQSPYLNGAMVVETALAPEALLNLLQQIEAALGRERREHWGPRVIDLDLLLCGQTVCQTPSLTLPHPRMTWRRFVLEPAALVAGDALHPLSGWTLRQHLDHLNSTPCFLAIAGPLASRKTELAAAVARTATIAPGPRGAAAFCSATRSSQGHLRAFSANPAGHARPMALEFLDAWRRQIAADRAQWSSAAALVSDFCFHEALALARTWLAAEAQKEYDVLWEAARAAIVRPRLVVLLEVSARETLRRVREVVGPEAWQLE